MSKLVKQLITDDLSSRLKGVNEALLVSVAGLNAAQNFKLRRELRSKNISLLVVKNSLARRAANGTPLAAAFDTMEGAQALVWGGEDIVSLAKIITKLTDDKAMAPFVAKGGVMDGARLSAEQVKAVSSWPSRTEVLSIIAGQILGPGSKLAAQLNGPGGSLVSQLKEKAKEPEGEVPAA